MTRWEVRRRDLLKGLAVGLGCLPVMYSDRAWSQTAGVPKKLLIIVNSEGYRQTYWRPKNGSLMTQTLPVASSPMEPHKADLIFLPGLSHPTFTGNQHGAFPNHLSAGPNSGVAEYRVPYTASIDQFIGSALATSNNLPRATLNLAVLASQGTMGEGNNSRFASYKGMDQAVTPEQDPYKTFGQIFGGATTPSSQSALTKRLLKQQSILDFVAADLEKFAARAGTDYKVVAGGHLQAIRDLEKQLETVAPRPGSMDCEPLPADTPTVSATDTANYPTLLKLQMDLAVAALRCDVTRVVVLQVADAGGVHIPFNFVPGVTGQALDPVTFLPIPGQRSWHDLAHSPITGGVDMKALVDQWFMGQFASVLDRMKAAPEPGGTMLDNSVVLITNHMEDGLNHNCQRLPWMMAGSCQGYFKTGQCASSVGKPIGGVLADICNAMGVSVPFFGDATYGIPWDGLRA